MYKAGAREFSWIKLKRECRSELADTIDLVIIGASHGRGRRRGVYGTFLLAAYDKDRDVFPSITKIGTGFSDEDLQMFPKLLKPYESEVKPPNVESLLVPDVWLPPEGRHRDDCLGDHAISHPPGGDGHGPQGERSGSAVPKVHREGERREGSRGRDHSEGDPRAVQASAEEGPGRASGV